MVDVRPVCEQAYAGIGSRSTPLEILELMQIAAEVLATDGYVLRSGHARGADQEFEVGAAGRAQVFLPWPSFEPLVPVEAELVIDHPSKEARAIAAEFHPTWAALKSGAQALHARNVYQVLGPNLDPAEKSKFVLCWTPRGEVAGGTGQALRVAEHYEVPVFNLAFPLVRERIHRMIERANARC